jgi:hypothetical protein
VSRFRESIFNTTDVINPGPPPDTTSVIDTTFVGRRTKEVDNQFTWRTGASASTKFFGTFYPRVGPLTGLWHTMTPNVSYSFTPPQGGRDRAQSFSVSLRNALDVKVRDNDKKTEDGEPGERKITNVVNWSLGSSYNPDASEKRNWTTIRSNFNTQVLGIDLSLSNSVDPYEWVVTSTQVTSGFRYSGLHSFGLIPEQEQELNVVASDTTRAAAQTLATPSALGEPGEGLPWNVSASLSFSKERQGDPRSNFNVNGSINITRAWRVQYDTRYDIQGRELLGYGFSVYRDLHCWEMSFNRRQLADDWEFFFQINLKSHPEIKVEQGDRGLGAGGFFGSGQF